MMANTGTLFSGEVTLYFHNGGTVYYCRFKSREDSSRYIKKSLKTRDYTEAVSRAKRMYLKHIALVDAGFDPTELNWEQAVEVYAGRMDEGHPKSFLIQCNKTYFAKFFTTDRFKTLRDINSRDIDQYFKWRSEFWKHQSNAQKQDSLIFYAEVPSPATLEKERRFIGLIFKGLFRDRRINRMPDMPTARRLRQIVADRGGVVVESQNRRPRFEPYEYAKIKAHLHERVKATDGWKPSVQLLSAKRLILWCELIARTGIRPQELRKVEFRDFRDVSVTIHKKPGKYEGVVIKDDDEFAVDDWSGFIRGQIRVRRNVAKTKKPRWASDIEEGGFRGMLSEWKALNEEVLGYKMNDDDLVFPSKRWRSDPDAKWKTPIDMSTAVKKMLRSVGLYEVIDEDGNILSRSSYSLRAMFITQQIKRNIPTRFIAENCGTSEKMINQFYDGSDGANFFESLNSRYEESVDSD